MASRGVNKVILVGNVGKDPETRTMPNGNTMVTFSLATSETWKDQQGVKQERTEWHRLVAFGKLADIIGKYVRRGSKLYLEGSLHTRKYQDKDGTERYSTEVTCHEVQMLDRADGAASQHERPSSAPTQSAAPPADSHDFDDDIPF